MSDKPTISQEGITKDFTPNNDKPLWPLSSYGPAKYQANLLTGLDESPEELRVRAVQAIKNGNMQEYMSYESNRISAAEATFGNARSNVGQLYQQAVNSFNASPPTVTGFRAEGPSSTSAFGGSSSAFGAPANPSAFGKPTGFGASAFGNTSTPSAFGGSAFGQSTFNQPSAFGRPSQGTSAFAQPSAFGQASSSNPTFGQTAQSGSAFSQASKPTSAFGQTPQNAPSAFATPAQPTSAFGQLSQPASAFGQSAFGQTTAPQTSLIKPSTGAFGTSATAGGAFSNLTSTPLPTTTSGFSAFSGQPNTFGMGALSNTTNITSAPAAAPQSVFGQSAFSNTSNTTTTSAFGVPSSFGAQTQTQSPFGSAPSAFGSTANQNNPPAQSAFGPPVTGQGQSAFATPSVFGSGGGSTFGQPASTFGATQGTFADAPVAQEKPKSTKPDFANAKSSYKPGLDKYDALLPENYAQLLPESARKAFEAPKFEWGNIPEWVPPKEMR